MNEPPDDTDAAGPGPDEQVGSLAEEAVQLLGALSDWARDADRGRSTSTSPPAAPSAPGARSAAPCTPCARPARRCAPTSRRPRRRCSRPPPGCSPPPCRRGTRRGPRQRGRAHRPRRRPRRGRRLARGGRRMTLACGIDVGGTKIAGGVVDEDGTILEELRVESPGDRRRGDRGGHRRPGQGAALPPRHRGGRRRRRRLRRQGPRRRDVRAQHRLAQRRPEGRAREAGRRSRS